MNVSPLKSAEGGAVITHSNITDRKLAEIALRTSEFTVRSLLASAPQSVIAADSDGKIVFVNGSVDPMFGYSPANWRGSAWHCWCQKSFARGMWRSTAVTSPTCHGHGT